MDAADRSALDQLERLQRHGAWADAQLLAALRRAPSPVPAALRELAHVRGAQEVWLARIEERRATLEVWPELTRGELERVGAMLDGAYGDLITHLQPRELVRTLRYRTSSGAPDATALGDVLLHLYLHGQYHRGKANAALRAAGAQPASVDLIAWVRSGSP